MKIINSIPLIIAIAIFAYVAIEVHEYILMLSDKLALLQR